MPVFSKEAGRLEMNDGTEPPLKPMLNEFRFVIETWHDAMILGCNRIGIVDWDGASLKRALYGSSVFGSSDAEATMSCAPSGSVILLRYLYSDEDDVI